jgi:hypothetical protein
MTRAAAEVSRLDLTLTRVAADISRLKPMINVRAAAQKSWRGSGACAVVPGDLLSAQIVK